MRIARNIFATAFAVVLASGLAACEADQTEFEETPPAQEIEVFEEEPAVIEEPVIQDEPAAEPLEEQPQEPLPEENL